MDDLLFLFALLFTFYLFECAAFVRRDELVVTTWLGRRWTARFGARFLGNARGGVVLRAPLPPLGAAHVVQPLPFSVGPEGLLGYVSTCVHPDGRPAQSGELFTWEEVSEAGPRVSGREILIGRRTLAVATSSRAAEHAGRLIARLARATSKERERSIRDALAAAMDVDAVKRTADEQRRRSQTSRFFANVLFLELLVLLPLSWALLGVGRHLLGASAAVVITMLIVDVAFFRAHRRLYPEQRAERWLSMIEIALFPPATVRAADHLSRHALDAFHPLAVAAAFLPEQELFDLARRMVLDLQHPIPPREPEERPLAKKTEAWYRAALERAVLELLSRQRLDLKRLTAPPSPSEAGIGSYCPRCHAQYQRGDGSCEDCGGLDVVRFADAGVSTAR